MKALVQQYLDYLEVEKNRSAKTIENYHRYLLRLFRFLKTSYNSRVITLEGVRKFRISLNRAGLSVKTQNYYMIALRGFLSYLARNNIKALAPEKIELAKEEEREVAFLEPDELVRLAIAPDKERDRAIIALLFSTGLRISELVALDRDAINFDRGEFHVRGKGGKIRPVFVSEQAADIVKHYLATREDTVPAMFVSKLESRLTPRSIQRIIRGAAQKAGLTKKVTPHTLRHSFGTDLLRSGADLRSIQQLLGHASITTTQIYTHVTSKHLKDVHRKHHQKG